MPNDPRPTEQHFHCPNCKVPRFLAAASRGLHGTLRIKCPKCRKEVVYALSTGAIITTQPLRTTERELRCGGVGCRRWFLAGVVITEGDGHVRLQCPKVECKRSNRFLCSPTSVETVELPVA